MHVYLYYMTKYSMLFWKTSVSKTIENYYYEIYLLLSIIYLEHYRNFIHSNFWLEPLYNWIKLHKNLPNSLRLVLLKLTSCITYFNSTCSFHVDNLITFLLKLKYSHLPLTYKKLTDLTK